MKTVKRILALLLVFILVFSSLIGCGKKGKPLLKLDKSEISINLFQFYLSRMKGVLCSSSAFGTSALSDDFWDTFVDVYDRTTYNTEYTKSVLESAKTYLAALALFEERGLKLPDSYIDAIDAELEEMIQNEAGGSKASFNAILSQYGINYEMLKEAYVIEKKIEYLRDDLFGANGSKISESIIDDYYRNNYARFKQVFLYSYEYQYVTDRNGDVMYYKSNNRISYDTTKTLKTKENGDPVYDENGDKVYVYTDDKGNERIAYDTAAGERQPIVDSDGKAVVKKYNDTEMEILKQQRDEILAQAADNDMLGFDVLISKYNEDAGAKEYPGGYYVTKNTNYESPEVLEKLFEMEIGEVECVQSDYGIHIIMRCELEDNAYASEEYENLFISNSTGTYLFMDTLKLQLMTEYLAPYMERITVDEELLKTVDIKSVEPNYNY